MSTDSKPHSTAQPPLSQLWPGFGTTTSDTIIMGSPQDQQQQQQQQHKYINMTKLQQQQQQQQNNNSKYVNFNQFIMQHNLAPPQQTKPQLTSASMDRETSIVNEFDEVSDYIHNIGGALNNNNRSAKESDNGTNTNYRQQRQQQYNVSKQKKSPIILFLFCGGTKVLYFWNRQHVERHWPLVNIVDDVKNMIPLL